MTIISDTDIKLNLNDNLLTIRIRGTENMKRIFPGQPAGATFKPVIPDEAPISEAIAIKYEN